VPVSRATWLGGERKSAAGDRFVPGGVEAVLQRTVPPDCGPVARAGEALLREPKRCDIPEPSVAYDVS